MSRKSAGSTLETVKTIVYAVLIAMLVRTFAYEPFNIPSGSMKPTLLIGDYLFVSKIAYGYSRHAFPYSWPAFSGRIWSAPVTRGDVVVFKQPPDDTVDFIKRIVGVPGDRIQVKGGILYINDRPVERQEAGQWVDDSGTVLTRYIETLPNGVQHSIVEESDDRPNDDTDVFEVPPGHYFAMGDNRDNSHDSRAWGFVPEENLVGRASFIFYSTAGDGPLWKVWNSLPATRFDRLFTSVH